MPKVSAIVPTFNESVRIASVLEVLSQNLNISEILVVDDGSTDDTYSAASTFPKVKYIRNQKNMGKGYCLKKGMRAAKNSVVLCCDADLVGLTNPLLNKVIDPVLRGKADMFIGMFYAKHRPLYDLMLRFSGFPSGINSGLRALTKSVWRSLPDRYKKGFRSESGLNYLVKWKFRGPEFARLDYTQVPKEHKRGFMNGSYARVKMSIETALNLFWILLYEKHFGFGKSTE